MMIKTRISLLVLFITASIYPNVFSRGTEAGNLVIYDKQIVLESETVEITAYRESLNVHCKFILVNTAKRKKIRIGFPDYEDGGKGYNIFPDKIDTIPGNPSSFIGGGTLPISNFWVKINGNKAKVSHLKYTDSIINFYGSGYLIRVHSKITSVSRQ